MTPPFRNLKPPLYWKRTSSTVHGVWALVFNWATCIALFGWLSLPLGLTDITGLQDLAGDWIQQAKKFAAVLPPPPYGIRYALLWLTAVLLLVLCYLRTELKASHDKVLTSPKEFRELNEEEKQLFSRYARSLETWRICLTGTLFLLGEAYAINFAYAQHPQITERLFWPSLLHWL